MRSARPRPTPRPALAAALAAALACSDAPPAAPGALPAGFDVALVMVVVAADAAATADGTRSSGAAAPARPALAVAPTAVTVSPPIDLGTLGGPDEDVNPFEVASDVNDAGQVVGTSRTASGELHAFRWTPEGGLQDLGTLGGSTSRATSINDAGHVVGESTTAMGESHPFLWTPERGMRDLGVLDGSYSLAFGINAAGQVVGISSTVAGGAFLWQDDGQGMRALGTLGGDASEALAINDAGHVVGTSQTASGDYHAFLWTPEGGMRDLGTLGGSSLPRESHARGINAAGQVVGLSTSDASWRAFLWRDDDRGMRDLGAEVGGYISAALGINASGQVVGTVYSAPDVETGIAVPRAFFWQPGTGAVLLPLLPGDVASEARALNDRGQVVGWSMACDREGCVRGARPVLWMVGTGGEGTPLVDRLHAAVLPPGVVPGLSGVWLRVRLRDPGDAGPWDWRIDWGDGTVHTPTNVRRTGEFAFLRAAPYTTPGPHTITVTATDPAGLTSRAATITVP